MKSPTEHDFALLTDAVTGEISPDMRSVVREWVNSHPDRAYLLERFTTIHGGLNSDVLELPQDSPVTGRVRRAVFAKISVRDSVESFRGKGAKHGSRQGGAGIWMGGIALAAALVMGWVMSSTFNSHGLTQSAVRERSTIQRFVTNPGEQVIIELIDGSRVTLAPQSQLTYDAGFGTRDRRLILSGRAVFDITHNTRFPLIVEAGNASVQVLGTQFSVSAIPGDSSIDVVVRSGKVALRAGPVTNATGVALSAGDQGVLRKDGLVTVFRDVDVDQLFAWAERRTEEQSLQSVAQELERRFGIDVIVDPALANILVTASFGNEFTDAVIRRLAAGVRAKVKYIDGTYHITP